MQKIKTGAQTEVAHGARPSAGLRLTDFLGDWQLSRQIKDASGAIHLFDGTATFTPQGAGLGYLETGLLTLADGAVLRSERRYLWQQVGGRIHLRFADGRPFHDFDPQGDASAHHLCPPDTYDVRYDFAAWPRWSSQYRVTGPAKNYVMASVYVLARPAPMRHNMRQNR